MFTLIFVSCQMSIGGKTPLAAVIAAGILSTGFLLEMPFSDCVIWSAAQKPTWRASAGWLCGKAKGTGPMLFGTAVPNGAAQRTRHLFSTVIGLSTVKSVRKRLLGSGSHCDPRSEERDLRHS